jgi:hypothetical protein
MRSHDYAACERAVISKRPSLIAADQRTKSAPARTALPSQAWAAVHTTAAPRPTCALNTRIHAQRTRNAQVTKSTFFTWERTSQWLPWMTMGERKGYIQCAPDLTHRGCGRTVASVRSIDAPQHRLTVLLAQQCALRATARRTKCAPVAR